VFAAVNRLPLISKDYMVGISDNIVVPLVEFTSRTLQESAFLCTDRSTVVCHGLMRMLEQLCASVCGLAGALWDFTCMIIVDVAVPLAEIMLAKLWALTTLLLCILFDVVWNLATATIAFHVHLFPSLRALYGPLIELRNFIYALGCLVYLCYSIVHHIYASHTTTNLIAAVMWILIAIKMLRRYGLPRARGPSLLRPSLFHHPLFGPPSLLQLICQLHDRWVTREAPGRPDTEMLGQQRGRHVLRPGASQRHASTARTHIPAILHRGPPRVDQDRRRDEQSPAMKSNLQPLPMESPPRQASPHMCSFCLTEESSVLLRPCNHVCLCVPCTEMLMAEEHDTCPVCRGIVMEREIVFLS